MKCPACGIWNRKQYTVCFRCGASLVEGEEAPQQDAQNAPNGEEFTSYRPAQDEPVAFEEGAAPYEDDEPLAKTNKKKSGGLFSMFKKKDKAPARADEDWNAPAEAESDEYTWEMPLDASPADVNTAATLPPQDAAMMEAADSFQTPQGEIKLTSAGSADFDWQEFMPQMEPAAKPAVPQPDDEPETVPVARDEDAPISINMDQPLNIPAPAKDAKPAPEIPSYAKEEYVDPNAPISMERLAYDEDAPDLNALTNKPNEEKKEVPAEPATPELAEYEDNLSLYDYTSWDDDSAETAEAAPVTAEPVTVPGTTPITAEAETVSKVEKPESGEEKPSIATEELPQGSTQHFKPIRQIMAQPDENSTPVTPPSREVVVPAQTLSNTSKVRYADTEISREIIQAINTTPPPQVPVADIAPILEKRPRRMMSISRLPKSQTAPIVYGTRDIPDVKPETGKGYVPAAVPPLSVPIYDEEPETIPAPTPETTPAGGETFRHRSFSERGMLPKEPIAPLPAQEDSFAESGFFTPIQPAVPPIDIAPVPPAFTPRNTMRHAAVQNEQPVVHPEMGVPQQTGYNAVPPIPAAPVPEPDNRPEWAARALRELNIPDDVEFQEPDRSPRRRAYEPAAEQPMQEMPRRPRARAYDAPEEQQPMQEQPPRPMRRREAAPDNRYAEQSPTGYNTPRMSARAPYAAGAPIPAAPIPGAPVPMEGMQPPMASRRAYREEGYPEAAVPRQRSMRSETPSRPERYVPRDEQPPMEETPRRRRSYEQDRAAGVGYAQDRERPARASRDYADGANDPYVRDRDRTPEARSVTGRRDYNGRGSAARASLPDRAEAGREPAKRTTKESTTLRTKMDDPKTIERLNMSLHNSGKLLNTPVKLAIAIVVALIVLALLIVFLVSLFSNGGAASNPQTLPSDTQLDDKNAPIISTGTVNGNPGHIITFKGNDGDMIYISDPINANITIAGGIGLLEIEDSTLIGEQIVNEDIDITLNPVLHDGKTGKDTAMSPITFTVTPPEALLEIITPENGKEQVGISTYQIKIRVALGSTVTINDEDVSDLISDQPDSEGVIVYNVNVKPIGDNVIPIVVKTAGYRITTKYITLYREARNIALELSADTPTISETSTVTIKGTVAVGAKLEVTSPTDGSVTLNADGTFSFKAKLANYGNNTITIVASMNGETDTPYMHVINYMPTPDDYTKAAWRMDYDQLTYHKGQVFKCVGKIAEVLNEDPYTFTFNVGSESSPKLVVIEMIPKSTYPELGTEYKIYADVIGESDDGLPLLTGRYFYAE